MPQEWFASLGLRPQEMRLYAKLGDWQQVPLTLQQAGGGFAAYSASPPLAGAYALVAVKKYFEIETVERRAWETSLGGPASPKDSDASAPALTGATVFGLTVSAQSLAIPVFLVISATNEKRVLLQII